jgi:hypothetical protein
MEKFTNLLVILLVCLCYHHDVFGINKSKNDGNKLKKYDHIVQISGDNLIIKLKNGNTSVLKNNRSNDCEKYAIYTFQDYFENCHNVLIEVGRCEWGEYKLIDINNGKITDLEGIPIFSPNNKFIVVACSFVNLGISSLSIFEFKNNEFNKIYKNDKMGCYIYNPQWITNYKIKFTKDYLNKQEEGIIVYQNNKWEIKQQ